MITRQDIERLAAIRTDEGIVSAYIKVDPRLRYERGQPSMKFKGAYARARRDADERTSAVLERERDRILSFLEGWTPAGRGVAIFSSEPDNIWEVHPLEVTVSTSVTVASNPDVRFLVRILDELPKLAVLLLDGGDARLYAGQQRSAEEVASHSEELPSRHDQGGWSQARYQRHVEFHHTRVLREMADQVSDVFHNDGFDRLVLVGVEETTKEFEGLLSDPIRQRVIGHLPADFKSENDSSILERAGLLAEEQERSAEVALVSQIANFADARGKGVLGLDETLLALIAGNVDTLVVADGLSSDGSVCHNCDYFSAQKFSECPNCGSTECEEVSDIVEHAIEYAYVNGSQVNVVFDAASEMLLARGGIGALLRYVPPSP